MRDASERNGQVLPGMRGAHCSGKAVFPIQTPRWFALGFAQEWGAELACLNSRHSRQVRVLSSSERKGRWRCLSWYCQSFRMECLDSAHRAFIFYDDRSFSTCRFGILALVACPASSRQLKGGGFCGFSISEKNQSRFWHIPKSR